MNKFTILILGLILSISAYAVPLDTKIKVTANGLNKSLYAAITDGDISGGTPVQEVPAGSGTSFTLSYTPKAAANVILTIDGLILTQGSGLDYTISGTGITLATALEAGQVIYAIYIK